MAKDTKRLTNPPSSPSQEVPIAKDPGSRFRSVLWSGIVLIAICFLGYYYFIGQVDEKLTGEILKRIRHEFPKHIVTLDRSSLQPGQSIRLEGLRIQKPTPYGPRDVVRVGRIECHGPIDWVSLAQGQLVVHSVDVDSVELSAWPTPSGEWSFEELGTGKPIPDTFPAVRIHSGLVRIGCEPGKDSREIVCHDLAGQIELMPRVVGQQVMPVVLQMNVALSSSYFRRFQIQARINQDKTEWKSQGQLQEMDFSPQLTSQMPIATHRYLNAIEGLSGQLSLQFAANRTPEKLEYSASGSMTRGRWHHPQVPFPMDEISGDIQCENGDLRIRNLKARSSNATFQADADWRGMSMDAPLSAFIRVQNLELDRRLYDSVPEPIQEIWDRVRPTGHIDAVADVQFDGSHWSPHVQVQAKNCSVDADYFPYPVHSISGRFDYTDGKLSAPELSGRAGQVPVNARLLLTRARPRWLMDFAVWAEGPIPIDEKLVKALTPRGAPPSEFQNFVESLHPLGTIHLRLGQFQRTADDPDVVSKRVELTFSECSIKYDQFKYPIVDVHGEAVVVNDRLELREFVGRNDGARIKANGYCEGGGDGSGALAAIDLEFNAFDISLDEELQSALPAGVRSLWDELQPTGSMDHVQVTLTKSFLDEPLDLRVEMKEDRDHTGNVSRSVAFRPRSIPYSIHDVACQIKYRPGRIDILSLSGVHESSRLLTTGVCRLHPNGTWDGIINWLETTRFIVDQSLVNCLPKYLRDPMMMVDFRGPVSVTGTTKIASPRSASDSIVRSWDLDVQLEDGRLGGGGIASGIRGAIAIEGVNTPSGPMAFGTMEIDALSVKGVAATGVQGPFAFTQTDLYFGRDAIEWQNRMDIQPSRNGPLHQTGEGRVANYELERSSDTALSAVYFDGFSASPNGTPESGEGVVQASAIRTNLHNRLDARFAAMTRETPTEDSQLWIPPARDMPQLDLSEHDVRARTLGGTMFLSGTEPLDGNRARYRLRLVDSQLRDCMLDLGELNTIANGKLSVQCDIQGSLTSLSTIEGTGNAWLREAKLYELPVVIRMFRLLSVRPDQGAFDAADVAFAIDGERYPIREILLDGDLVSMKGSGWINVRRELQLDLQANVSRRTIVGAMMRPLAPSNSANLFRLEVTGTASDPQVKRPMALMNSWEPVMSDTR